MFANLFILQHDYLDLGTLFLKSFLLNKCLLQYTVYEKERLEIY